MPQTLADARRLAGETEWVWPGWLAKGYVTLLTGRKGLGKSTVAMDWFGRSLLLGEAFPDGFKPHRDPREGGVEAPESFLLWLEAEAGQALNAERALALGVPLEKIRLFDPPTASSEASPFRHFTATPASLLWVRQQALLPGCVGIVLDALSGANGDDENAAKVGKIVLALADIAQAAHKPVLVLHHKSKRQRDREGTFVEDSLESVRGSSAIVQYARIVVSLDAPLGDNIQPFRISQFANNLVALPPSLGYELGGGVSYCEAPKKGEGSSSSSASLGPAAAYLQEALFQGPQLASDLIQDGMAKGLSESSLRRAKKVLGVEARKSANGLWFWELEGA